MTKDSNQPIVLDTDRKHGKERSADSPRVVKNFPGTHDAFTEDKRKEARQEHTNHFTSRAGHGEKK